MEDRSKLFNDPLLVVQDEFMLIDQGVDLMLNGIVLPMFSQEGEPTYFILTEMFTRELPQSEETSHRLDEIFDGNSGANDDEQIDNEEWVSEGVVHIPNHDGKTEISEENAPGRDCRNEIVLTTEAHIIEGAVGGHDGAVQLLHANPLTTTGSKSEIAVGEEVVHLVAMEHFDDMEEHDLDGEVRKDDDDGEEQVVVQVIGAD